MKTDHNQSRFILRQAYLSAEAVLGVVVEYEKLHCDDLSNVAQNVTNDFIEVIRRLLKAQRSSHENI